MRNLYLAILIIFVLISNSHAGSIEKYSCPALSDKSLYVKNNLRAYKILSPGKNDFIFRTSTDYRDDFSLNTATIKNFVALNDALKKKNITLVLFFIPTRGMTAYNYVSDHDKQKFSLIDKKENWKSYGERIDTLNQKGIISLGFQESHGLYPEDLFFKYDHHWRPEAAQMAAGIITAIIKAMPTYQEIEKENFITKQDSTKEYKGTFAKVYKKLCNTIIPTERVKNFITTSTKNNNDEALFGNDKTHDIVLVGTSNSFNETSHSHFDGFLKTSLQADVFNLSVTGGGFSDSMIGFLSSDLYKNAPPKIVIWETPAYYDLNKQNSHFKKLIELAR